MTKIEKAILFIPPLSIQIEAKEKNAGRDLSREEVEEIRETAPCIEMDKADRNSVYQDRGYSDLNPNNVWQEWLDYKAKNHDA